LTLDEFLSIVRRQPLIVSAQASPGPLKHRETLVRIAQCSAPYIGMLRLEGVEDIRAIRAATGLPCIGLIKKHYPNSEVYITPTAEDVRALIDCGCEVIGIDGTQRGRPNGESMFELFRMIHEAGRLAMADCDNLPNALAAKEAGADIIGTTLSGYTADSRMTDGPDLRLLANLQQLGVPIIAEGRYRTPGEMQTALALGACAVVIGAAINDPLMNTKRFAEAVPSSGPIGCFDIGGTWLRFAVWDGGLHHEERVALPQKRAARLDWMLARVRTHGLTQIGISSGGTLLPYGVVIESKPSIPENEGTNYAEWAADHGFSVATLNDGLATAWAHAWHPDFIGSRVASLALGTGVGLGISDRGRLMVGPRGEYPRLNDLPTRCGKTFEELLGGASLTPDPSPEQREAAQVALHEAVQLIRDLYMPDEIVLCGGVGHAEWLESDLPRSPYGADAGLMGAAALVRFQGWGQPWPYSAHRGQGV
jgi:putative N-acetylmannosamine-6-phosphate epimerase